MTSSRKAFRKAQEVKLRQRKIDQRKARVATVHRNKNKAVAGALLAVTLTTAGSGLATAPAAFAIDSTQSVSSVADARIDSPTLKGFELTEYDAGHYMLAADVYTEQDESPVIKADLDPKMVPGNGDAEYTVWQDEKAKSDAQDVIKQAATNEWAKWSDYSWTYSNDTMMYTVTLKDGSVREYNSTEEITAAEESARTNYDREQAEYAALIQKTSEAQAAYETAVAPKPDLANYTFSLSLGESNYESLAWETTGGTLEKGDSFTAAMNGVTATATVVSTTADGTITFDVSLSKALDSAATAGVSYTTLSPAASEAAPGTATDDKTSTVWDGNEILIPVTENDAPTEGAEWISVLPVDPATGEATYYQVKTEGATFGANGLSISFKGIREFTGDSTVEYEARDSEGNTVRAFLTVSQTGKKAWVQTTPTDVSKIDLSDPKKFHLKVKNGSAFTPKEYANNPAYNSQYGLIEADKPTAINDVIKATQGMNLAVDVLATDNAGVTRDSRFGYDPKAQDRLIEDASLQAINPATGKAISIGESFVIPGVATYSVVPATGSAAVSPIQYGDNGEAVGAYNQFDRPYIAITVDRAFKGELPKVDYRWKSVAYGETTADLDAFWAQYDADGTGAEFVGAGKVLVRMDAPNYTDGVSLGYAAELNGPAEKPSADFDYSNYSGGFSAGSGATTPLVAKATDDSASTEPGKEVRMSVLGNDAQARLALNAVATFAGSSTAGEKPFGFKAADGSLVKELVVAGKGKFVINEVISYTDAEGMPTKEITDTWQKNAFALFIPEAGFTGNTLATFVNNNVSSAANGITVNGKSTAGSDYTYETSTLRLVDSEGNRVSEYSVPEVGTWKVDSADIVFSPVPTYTGTAVAKYSVLDKWTGTEQEKALANYDLAVRPYGAETVGMASVQVAGPVEEIPTPEETPVPTPEETPVPTPEDTPVPTPEDTPVPTPEDTPVPTPTDTPTPDDTPEDVPTPDDTPEDVPTPDDTPEDTPKPDDTPEDTPETSTIPKDTPETSTIPTDVPEDTPADSITEEEIVTDDGISQEEVTEDLAHTGTDMSLLLLSLGFSATGGAVAAYMWRRNRKASV